MIICPPLSSKTNFKLRKNMSSSESKDEHNSLKNELIFLSKLLHQHKKQKAKTHGTHHKQKHSQPNYDRKHSKHPPPCKKDMVWRRAGTASHDVKKVHRSVNVDQNNFSSVKTKHSVKYVNSVTRPSTASSTFNQLSAKTQTSVKHSKVNSVIQSSTLSLSAKTQHSGKYAKVKSVTQPSTAPSTSNSLSATQHPGKYAKVNSVTQTSTMPSTSNSLFAKTQQMPSTSNSLSAKTHHPGKYATVNYIAQTSNAASTSNQLSSAKTQHPGKYAKVNSVSASSFKQLSTAKTKHSVSSTSDPPLSAKIQHSEKYSLDHRSTGSSSSDQSQTGNSTSSQRNEKPLRTSLSKMTKWIKPSKHTLVAVNNTESVNLANESSSFLKGQSLQDNRSKTNTVKHPEVNHDKSKLTNNKLYSPTKNLVNKPVVSTLSASITKQDLSPKKSPNSKYVWRKEEKGLQHQMKGPESGLEVQLITGTSDKLNARQLISFSPESSQLSSEEFVSMSPEKYLTSLQQRNMAVRTRYKLHLDSPTSRSGKKVKHRKKTVYSNSSVYVSPNAKKSRSLAHSSSTKSAKSGSSKHKWVRGTKESQARSHGVKRQSTSQNGTGRVAGYSKSNFTWRKEQSKTKQVSRCGYKLVNVGKTSKTPHRNRTPFMERRKKYVNSHTPVLPQSRFKIRKKHSPAIAQSVKTAETTRTPLGRTVYNTPSALFTVRKTKRKIVRKPVKSSTSDYSHLDSGKEIEVTPVSAKEFKVYSSGKKLKRLRKVINTSISSIETTPRTSTVITKQFITSRKLVAQQVLHKSIVTSNQAKYKKHNQPTGAKRYCTYYNRFGKCSRGDKCQYVHDPEKVAVCTRFLRGKCKQTDGTCPFSHKMSKDKMPVCSYFLRGICNRDNCPYLHVNVSRNAVICQDFLRGYCPAGDECKKKHSLECPDYQRDGSCPRGRQCRLLHRQLKAAKRKTERTEYELAKKQKNVDIEIDVELVSNVQEEEGSVGNLPSFISLKDEGSDWFNTPNTSMQGEESSVTPELLLRPKFTSK